MSGLGPQLNLKFVLVRKRTQAGWTVTYHPLVLLMKENKVLRSVGSFSVTFYLSRGRNLK